MGFAQTGFLVCIFFGSLVHVFTINTNNSILYQFPSSNQPTGDCSASKIKKLSHLTVDPVTGRVYVGGKNRLLQLDSSLTLQECLITGPKEDSVLCHARGCDPSTQIEKILTDNYNKILVIDHEARTLIACGSIFQGACEKFKLNNISLDSQFYPHNIAANDESSSTYAFIGPEHYNWKHSNVLYVGTTFTNNGEYRPDVPAISSRALNTLEIAEFSYSKQSLLRIDVKYRDHFLVKYIYGFNSSDYAYFVIVQKQSHLPGQEEQGYVTRLARICINDANYDSYTEITIQCMVNVESESITYNLLQDAKLSPVGDELANSLGIQSGDSVLVATFSPSKTITNEPLPHSALCVFSMADIEAKFNENIHMCFNGSIKYRNMPYISGPILDGNCPVAWTTGNILSFCEVGLKISGFTPIKSHAALHLPNVLLTSITSSRTEKSTVVFLGSSLGKLKKVLLVSPSVAREYEEIIVNEGMTILPDTMISPSGEHLYVLTTNKVFKVAIEHCSSYTNCSSCLEANDPYCGWCSLERRCTVRSACRKASHSAPRWLSYGTGQQCIDFEQILPDKIPITQMTTVHLTIRTLPELPVGAKYRCVFGEAEPLDAGVTPQGLTCPTPNVKSRPLIPNGKDHILVPLSVRSSETNKDFVSRNFAFYDCSSHTKCISCVHSQWGCSWCVYENKCTHNTSLCQKIIVSGENSIGHIPSHGGNSCPQFSKNSKPLLLPNRVSKEIVLEVENMPSPQVGHFGFQCIVTIEGAKMLVPAKMEHQRIVCDKTMYSYEANTGEYTAEVSLVWNRNHHVDSVALTLYKCDILGSHRDHADCSLCVTREEKYRCGWCSSTCDYVDSCKHVSTKECPKPRIDMIKPLSGPIEGGTLVTIEGSNLGLREEDVAGKIHIGNTPCTLVEYDVSVRIVCRTGAASNEKVAAVVVGNQAGFTESSVNFSYKDVKLESVTPFSGPQSGGTQLAITGQYLNIGSKVSVFLDELRCVVNATQTSSSRLMCITSQANIPRSIKKLILVIDGANRTLSSPFVYKQDPSILEIKPLKSFISGGRMITVHGTNLNIIQKPEMIVYSNISTNIINKTACTVINAAQMECPSPGVNDEFKKTFQYDRKQRSLPGKSIDRPPKLLLKIGFLMDFVLSVRDLEKHYKSLRSQLIYVDDPNFFEFPNEVKLYKGDTLVIEGENLNYASDESDVNVTIGTVPCNVTSLAMSQLVCSPPQKQPAPTDENGIPTLKGLPSVVVRVGRSLRFQIGYLQYDMLYSYSFPPEAIVGIAAGVACLVFLFVIVLIVYRRKSTQAEREYKRIQIQMDTLESNVRSECKQAFAELQTDMTDLTADLESSGIPTLDHNEYIMKVFFPGVRDHPILHNTKNRITGPTTNYDAAMIQFEQLINNKYFIISFIETLEDQESFSIRDKVNVASLLMVVLMGKMEYATDILRHLLLRLIQKSVATKHPQLMLRRTESVVEKMLTNWMALCMYKYLKEYAGSSLFLLYKAIKHQIQKGPVDAVTHDARYSLSEERLLREQIQHGVVTLQIVQDDVDEKIQCKVLDCDTISQVKCKILDALYKNTPFSLRPSIHEVDLEWRHGRGGHLTLQDEDLTTKSICGWKKLNTLHHYGVKESAVMSLIPHQNDSYNSCKQPCQNCTATYLDGGLPTITGSNGDVETVPNLHVYHLVKPLEDHSYLSNKTSERTHKAIPEIFLTRLLSTKGTIQKFVDDFFSTILTANEGLPPSVKWLFDLFDEAAKRYNILDNEVVHAWKSNSLPLRFWVNFIKNPDFIFDINKTATVDSCLSVIAQTFMDSCSTTDHRLGKDSPSNKLLFAKDIPQYRDMVAKFYYDISIAPQITDQELSTAMQQLSAVQANYFHSISALKELYIYVTKYHDQIYDALEIDLNCKKLNLSRKLETVACILEGDQHLC
ncbi:plexin-B isoform X1 [Halyomorpha halys]|uniref:plexin-B isoform X1 n=1 Tax=Halyomorpha halys TaxID=286706 RepID=UPI0006D515D0|nr:plexin-B isoform X1 [Halyomorpha halys]XP_014294702.1 plexin-B isoform X1 [Halyomorpha halys]XP_014294703.1 plexin-B isoform X1 [Halyomorpha halys]XP_014294704.1 plexin-B isoform X1 [Halyomorpha halys]XP_014294705.1 plexin-B isoform X1 [Halyomorpha halys]